MSSFFLFPTSTLVAFPFNMFQAYTPVRTFAVKTASALPRAVFIDGCRTPFQTSGSTYTEFQTYQLGKFALQGLKKRQVFDAKGVDHLIFGTVIQEVKTANVGREAALHAGYPRSVPAHTVTMACISSNLAIAQGVDLISSGRASMIVAGGVETMSDVPIRWSRAVRQRMLASTKVKSAMGYFKLLKGLKMKDLAPELPAVAEFSSGEIMGHSADRLASRWGVGRLESDQYAYRSHTLAAQAQKDGKLDDVIPVFGSKGVISADNGIKADTTIEKLSTLKPAFIKPHGIVTAGNSSFLTDGGSACLITSEERAKKEGLGIRSVLKDYIFVAQDPVDELLLGPAYAIGRLLERNGLKLNDIDVWELHEAFASQVLANLNALDSEEFTKQAGFKEKVGRIDMDKLNPWGGSLSLGHPFGATGVRLVATATNRLIREDKKYAVVAACAAGGLGHAMLIERY